MVRRGWYTMIVSRWILFAMIVVTVVVAVLLSGCTGQPPEMKPPVPVTTPAVTETPTTTGTPEMVTLPPPPSPPPTTPAAATFDVKINSLTCTWSVKTGDYGAKSDCVRIISSGTAQGPVGARLELPILAWSDDKFTCSNWTLKSGALIAVGSTCRRSAGQPESTIWTVDTGGDNCPLKDYFSKSITHTVKIYNDDDLTPQKVDNETAACR